LPAAIAELFQVHEDACTTRALLRIEAQVGAENKVHGVVPQPVLRDRHLRPRRRNW